MWMFLLLSLVVWGLESAYSCVDLFGYGVLMSECDGLCMGALCVSVVPCVCGFCGFAWVLVCVGLERVCVTSLLLVWLCDGPWVVSGFRFDR